MSRFLLSLVWILLSGLLMGCTTDSESPDSVSVAIMETSPVSVPLPHVTNLQRADFSRDGRLLLTHARDGESILWNAANGQQLRILSSAGLPGWPTNQIVEWSPDGSQIVIGQRGDGHEAATLTLQESVTGRVLSTLPYSEDALPSDIVFNRDGRYLLAIDHHRDQTVCWVWETTTGALVWSPKMPLPYESTRMDRLAEQIDSSELSLNLATKRNASILLFLNSVLPDGQPLVPDRPLAMYNSTDGFFSPNAKCFITREESDVGYDEATLWDVQSCLPIERLFGIYDSPSVDRFLPDGQTYLVGEKKKIAQLLNTANGEVVRAFEGHNAEIVSLALSPNGRQVLSGDQGGTVILWNALTGDSLKTWQGFKDGVASVAFHPDGDRILIGSGGSTAAVYDIHSGKRLIEFSSNLGNRNVAHIQAQYSPDGERILARSRTSHLHPDWVDALWNSMTAELVEKVGASLPSHLVLSPNGNWAIGILRRSVNPGPPTYLWNTKTGKRVYSFPARASDLYTANGTPLAEVFSTPLLTTDDVSFERGSKLLVYSGLRRLNKSVLDDIENQVWSDRELTEWLRRSAQWEPNPPPTQSKSRYFLCRSDNQERLNVSGWGHSGYNKPDSSIGRFENGDLVRQYDASPLIPSAATLTSDQSKLIVAYNEPLGSENGRQKTLIVWDTETGNLLKTIDVTQPDMAAAWDIRILKVSPNQRYVALGYEYHHILLDLRTEETVNMGQTGPYSVTQPMVMFSPDSQTVLSLGQRHTLWDTERAEQLADLGAYNGVDNPVFSPHGKRLFAQVNHNSNGPSGAILLDCKTGQLDRRLSGPRVALIFSSSGERAIAYRGDLRVAELLDFDSGETLCKLVPPGASQPLDIWKIPGNERPGDERFVTTHREGLAIWDFETAEMVAAYISQSPLVEFTGNEPDPLFLNDPKRMVTVHDDATVLWDLASGTLLHRMTMPPVKQIGRYRNFASLGVQPNTLLTSTPGREAILWNLESGQQIRTFGGLPVDTERVWFSDDGRQLFCQYRVSQAAIVWDTDSQQIIDRFYLVNDGEKLVQENTQR